MDVVMRHTPSNQNIWIRLIKLYLNLKSLEPDELLFAFDQGVRALDDALPLWKTLIRHVQYKLPEIVSNIHNII